MLVPPKVSIVLSYSQFLPLHAPEGMPFDFLGSPHIQKEYLVLSN